MARRRPARRLTTTAVRSLELDDALAAPRADPSTPPVPPLEDLAGVSALDLRRARWREERARFEAHLLAKKGAALVPVAAEPPAPAASE